jgi:hypothetical protein
MELMNGLNSLIGRSVRKSILNPLIAAVLLLAAASSPWPSKRRTGVLCLPVDHCKLSADRPGTERQRQRV